MNSSCMRNSRLRILACIVCLCMAVCACDTASTNVPPKEAGYSQTHNWERVTIADVPVSGTTIPYLVARQDADFNVHMAYYSGATAPDGYQYQRLNYLVWNPANGTSSSHIVNPRPSPTGVVGFDTCDQFDLALNGTAPVLIYPTYQIHHTNLQREADIMVNFFNNGAGTEYTAAIGPVERNGVFDDGHATESMSVAIDSQGNLHAAYMFFYEGIDSANGAYPDLWYVQRDPATLGNPMTVDDYLTIEEQVEGNYFGTYGVHNSVGYACELILNPEERPVIAYARHDNGFAGEFALKVAEKNEAGQWVIDTVDDLDDGWEVAAISVAYFPPDPEDPEAERPLAIAYGLRSPDPEPDDSHRLMLAVRRDGEWATEVVDETTWCGNHCSLAFTPEGMPAIAYLDEMSHSGYTHHYLKYAEFNGVMWIRESAEEEGLVGIHNTLWFDALGRPNISTYAEDDMKILVIRQIN